MRIKIHNVMGLGFFIGEKIDEDDEKIYLKYPGMLLPNQRTQQGFQDLIMDPIPTMFANKNDLMKKFPIKKNNELYHGKPTMEILNLYSEFCQKASRTDNRD
uniref:Uncharacterized protein n=1 Tax=viral metagenome TaxID=1070528 RepID=A0A6M3K8E4_9ZZZZ